MALLFRDRKPSISNSQRSTTPPPPQQPPSSSLSSPFTPDLSPSLTTFAPPLTKSSSPLAGLHQESLSSSSVVNGDNSGGWQRSLTSTAASRVKKALRLRSSNSACLGLKGSSVNGGSNSSPDHKPLASNSQLGSTKRIKLPNTYVDVFIGKTEDAIKYIEMESGARIQLTSDADHNSNMLVPNRTVELMGNPDQIEKAEDLINWILKVKESSGEGGVCSRAMVMYKIKRKLSAGPAIGEELTLPYDMKCKGCTSVIAAGVKFADYEREEVKYSIFPGKVRRFTVKCPCCPNEIVIETCHFNPWYGIVKGAERTPKPERKQASGVSNSNIKWVPPAWPNAPKIIYPVARKHKAV